MIPLTEIFAAIDDFCNIFNTNQKGFILPNPNRKRKRICKMCMSEIITILIMFQFSHYRTFKDFYLDCILIQYRKEFPNYVSYNRFVELIPFALMPMAWMATALGGTETGMYFIDSTKLPVCHNLRINRHRVFKGCAQRGKTSTGWFFGFKLHLVLNHLGEIIRFSITPGNVDDRTPVASMLAKLEGWLIGDRGYIGKNLKERLQLQGLELITRVKKNMKEVIIDSVKNCLIDKRPFVETAINQLKNMLHLSHTRHRSVVNFQVNIFSTLIAFFFKSKKPNAKFNQIEEKLKAVTSN